MKVFALQLRALVRLAFLELWRRHEVFGLLVLALALLVPLSLATPFGATGATRYLDELALLLIWSFSLFLSVGAGARLFPPEFDRRTIFPLLAKPISRARLVVGKFVGAVAAVWSALAFFYLLYAVSVLMRGGGLGREFVQAFALHLAFVPLAVAVTLLGSLVVTPSANLTLSSGVLMGMFFFGRKLPEYAGQVSSGLAWVLKAVYALAPHAEFFDMRQRLVHGWGGVEVLVVVVVLAYALCYAALCLTLATLVLKRKRL